MSAGEIARRGSEKRKGAARFEVDSDDKDWFLVTGRESAPMRA
jgi:hypothetical protein